MPVRRLLDIIGVFFTCSTFLFTSCQKPEVKWLREGTKQGKAGACEDALHSFEMAIQANPRSAQAYQGKGYTLELMGKPTEAMQAFDTAIALKGDYPHAWLSKGMLYLKLHQPIDANMAFTRALELQPDWDQAHYEKGLALTETERYDDAIGEFNQAAKLRPSLGSIFFARGKTYLAKGDTARFFSDLKSALKLDTSYAAKSRNDSTLAEMRGNAEFEKIVGR